MRFRARIVEPPGMRNLATIASTISKLSKVCCLKIGPSVLSFLISEENSSPKQTVVWCSISAVQFFNEYNLEGLTDSNEIYLELPSDLFSSSLSTLKLGNNNVRSVKIKLTSKLTPCITIDMELISEFANMRTCLHDIPVRVVPPDEWSDYSPPPAFDYCMSLDVSCIRKLRTVVERMKKLVPQVRIIGTANGCLEACAEADLVTVKTMFRNNDVSHISDDDKQTVSVKVDVKRLSVLLITEQIGPKRTICNFVDEKLLHFQLSQDCFVFHFFIVGIAD